MTNVKDQGAVPLCYGYSIMSIAEALYYSFFPLEIGDAAANSFSVSFPIACYLKKYHHEKKDFENAMKVIRETPPMEGREEYIEYFMKMGIKRQPDFNYEF